MRTWALGVLVLAMGCGASDPAPSGGACQLGAAQACVCGNGASGSRLCTVDGTWSTACTCAVLDAGGDGTVDVPGADGGDGTVDGASEAAADVVPDHDPRCNWPLTPCIVPSFGLSCVDTQTSAAHCGGCNMPCPTTAPICLAGHCVLR